MSESRYAEYRYSASPGPLPKALVAIAWVMILCGAWSVFDIVYSLTQNRVNLNFGVVALPLGRGLLRRSAWAWKGSLMVTMLMLVLIPACLLALFALTSRVGEGTYTIFGQVVDKSVGLPAFLTAFVAMFVYVIWQLRVLRRPDVKDVFDPLPFKPVDP